MEININEDDLKVDFGVDALVSDDTKDKFYEVMKQNGLDFDDIDEQTRLPKFMIDLAKDIDLFNHFNNMLYKLNKEKKFVIIDTVTWIIKDFLDPKACLKMLDEMNTFLLTNELKTKYKIDKYDDGMFEFFA